MSANEPTRELAARVMIALDASCDALTTLESLSRRADADKDGAELRVAQAIEALRHAIVSLRSAIRADESALALGFVLEEGRE